MLIVDRAIRFGIQEGELFVLRSLRCRLSLRLQRVELAQGSKGRGCCLWRSSSWLFNLASLAGCCDGVEELGLATLLRQSNQTNAVSASNVGFGIRLKRLACNWQFWSCLGINLMQGISQIARQGWAEFGNGFVR